MKTILSIIASLVFSENILFGQITVTLLPINAICYGSCNGIINTTVTGGTPPYTYSWSNTMTTQNIFSLCPGTYTVTVTDALSVTATKTASVSQPTMVSASTSSTNVSCNGGNNGSATVTPAGGTPSYTYLWSNGQTTATATNLIAGTYTVTVSDANNCTSTTSATITQPSSITITIVSQINSVCYGNCNGSVNITVTGGVPGYVYSWAGPSGYTSILEDISSLCAGSYTVTVTDIQGCTKTRTVPITQPTALNASISAQTNIMCYGQSTGSATVIASGGTPAYTYLWSNGQTTATASNLIAGTYTVTVTDSHGCTKTTSVTITQPTLLTVNIISTTNVSCNGGSDGSLTATFTGGTGTCTYDWSPNGFIGDGTNTYSNLIAGTYSVTAADVNLCTASASATITQPAPITVNAGVGQTICANNTATLNGTIGVATGGVWTTNGTGSFNPNNTTLNASYTPSALDIANGTVVLTLTSTGNGTCSSVSDNMVINIMPTPVPTASNNSPVCVGKNINLTSLSAGGTNYIWTGPNGFSSTLQNPTITGATPAMAGIYSVTVSLNACSASANTTVIVNSAPTVSITDQTNVSCNGGSDGFLSITATSGTPGYSYIWPNAAITPTISGLGIGNYTPTVTDANGCSSTVTAMVTEPPAIVLSSSTTSSNCNQSNGSATVVIASGGNSPWDYAWSNSESTMNTTSASNTISGLPAGAYSVTVTDNNGCTSSISINVNTISGLIASISASTNVSCYGGNDGTLNIIASGGATPYSWDIGTGAQPTGIFNDLTAGTYTVTVTDQFGCISTASSIITQPSALTLNSNQTHILCNGMTASAVVLVNDGTPPYSYLWSNGPTTNNATNLTVGFYFVTVTDNNGCSATITINITEPSILTVNILSQTNASCYNSNNGSVTATGSGGTTPYYYLWSNGNTDSTNTILPAGIYTVTISDVNGCTASTNAIITEPTSIDLFESITGASCFGNDGQISVAISGGTAPYNYSWDNFIPGNPITGLAPGTHFLTVTDANNCHAYGTYPVPYATFPAILSGTSTYSGGNLPAGNGIVNLFMESNGTGSGQFDSLTSQTLTSTGFYFNGLYPGRYFIKVDLTNPSLYPNLLNTYFNNAFLWTDADTINLVCNDTVNIPVQMYETTLTPTGNCNISGIITLQDVGGGKSLTFSNNTKATGEPVTGAEILIEQEPNDVPVQIAFTDQNGEYTLTNIPVGNDYHLLVDIPGYPMLSTFINISIGPSDTQLSNYNFLLDTASSGGIMIENQTGISNPFIESGFQFINIYPNPVTEFITVNFELVKNNSISIDLINEAGTTIKQLLNIPDCKKGTYHYQLNIPSTLSSGSYFIRLKNDRNTLVKKIILK